MNKTPTSTMNGVTPEEKFIGRRQDLAHLKVFGCITYVHIPDEKRTKLDTDEVPVSLVLLWIVKEGCPLL